LFQEYSTANCFDPHSEASLGARLSASQLSLTVFHHRNPPQETNFARLVHRHSTQVRVAVEISLTTTLHVACYLIEVIVALAVNSRGLPLISSFSSSSSFVPLTHFTTLPLESSD